MDYDNNYEDFKNVHSNILHTQLETTETNNMNITNQHPF
jgi:hypothetical protein